MIDARTLTVACSGGCGMTIVKERFDAGQLMPIAAYVRFEGGPAWVCHVCDEIVRRLQETGAVIRGNGTRITVAKHLARARSRTALDAAYRLGADAETLRKIYIDGVA